jgi:hypothetical protein
MYLQLHPDKILSTTQRLRSRIQERFPGSGLSAVSGEVCAIAEAAAERSILVSKQYVWLRAGAYVLLGVFVLLFVTAIKEIEIDFSKPRLTELVQALDAGIEAMVFCGGGIFFLLTLETRLKRRRALAALHELRSLAHVIDMHQLTKDPNWILSPFLMTPSSPERQLDRAALSRYLDYCGELLSLLGKIAALYVQHNPDHVVLSAVDEIESLTNGLSRKIWQKIMILNLAAGSMR